MVLRPSVSVAFSSFCVFTFMISTNIYPTFAVLLYCFATYNPFSFLPEMFLCPPCHLSIQNTVTRLKIVPGDFKNAIKENLDGNGDLDRGWLDFESRRWSVGEEEREDLSRRMRVFTVCSGTVPAVAPKIYPNPNPNPWFEGLDFVLLAREALSV